MGRGEIGVRGISGIHRNATVSSTNWTFYSLPGPLAKGIRRDPATCGVGLEAFATKSRIHQSIGPDLIAASACTMAAFAVSYAASWQIISLTAWTASGLHGVMA